LKETKRKEERLKKRYFWPKIIILILDEINPFLPDFSLWIYCLKEENSIFGVW
jgi:hypothetical protein